MNQENYNQLRIDIQKQIGYRIENLSQLKIVQEKIEWQTNKKIGFNTLRRFFGFLPTTAPNLNTLNTFSTFLGYDNYSAYLKKHLQDIEWFSWMQTIKIELSNSLNEENFQWLESQQNNFDFHLKVASIIKTLVFRKKLDVLHHFFDNRLFKFDEPTRLKLATSICLLFRSLDPVEIEMLLKHITHNRVFRENTLHWFVDYSNFNGYYGLFIKEAKKYALPESHEALFYDLIVSYNDYLCCNSNLKLIDLNRLHPDFFIVLQGRCLAYNLLYFSELKNNREFELTWEKLLHKITTSGKVNMVTIEVFPALLFLKDFQKTTYLIENYYEELLTLENWSSYPNLGMILITQTLHLIKENKIREAKIGFELIDLSKFSLAYYDYIKLFFLIAKYQLELASASETIKLIEIQTEYESIVNRTGFKRFSVDFMTHYLTNYDLD